MIQRTNNYLESYIAACRRHEILIGFELQTELDRLESDLNGDEYIYDTADADRRIDFIEKVVCLTKSPFYGKPMKLLLFQKAFLSALYGFKMKDGTDRFQRALFLLARKNGKSEFCSGLALTEMIIGGSGLDIVCSSNDDTQASILTDAVDKMRLFIDPDSKDTWRNLSGIKCFANGNKIFKLSSRVRNKEGRNIDFAISDEIHELKDNTIIKAIEQSQSLKINPKLILITTEGFVNDGVLDHELERARNVINGYVADKASERYLPWLYTQDSEAEVWQGSRENMLWQKSNPTIGKIKRFEYLEQQVDLARASKTDRVFVLSKDFNIKQSNSEAWLKFEDYNYEAEFHIEDFKGSLCIGGVDIAETTDLTSAKIIMMRPDSAKKYIYQMYFIPGGKLSRSDDKGAGAKYEEWAKAGLIRIIEGNYIDTANVADWFLELYQKHGLRPLCIGYDAKFANEFVNRMNDYGFDVEPVWQRSEVMSPAIRMCEADIQSQLIIGLNEIDKWCIGNSTLKVDGRGFAILDKIKGLSSRKIDGAVSLCIAYEIYRRHRLEFTNNLT